MIISKNLAGKSGSFNPFAFAVAAVAICAVMWGAVSVLAPAAATHQVSTHSTAARAAVGDGPGYLPAQYVNQATELAPMQYYTDY